MSEVEFKKRALNLLKEDEEFRYAVAGLLGMDAILGELRDLRRRAEEHDRKFNEILARLEEHDRRFEAIERRLEAHDRKFNEILARLEEHDRRFEEMGKKLDGISARLEVTLGSVGRRWGTDLERTVLGIFKETLEREGIEPGRVRKFRFKDVDGEYTGRRGTVIDVDVLVEDAGLYVMEVKSHAELDHLERLVDKVPVVERVLNRRAAGVYLIAVNVDEEVLERARELGVRVIYGSAIPSPEAGGR